MPQFNAVSFLLKIKRDQKLIAARGFLYKKYNLSFFLIKYDLVIISVYNCIIKKEHNIKHEKDAC